MRRITWKSRITAILVAVLLSNFATPTAFAIPTRSLTDRADEITGPQLHLIYLVAKDMDDRNWDTNGQIKKWVDQSQNWLATSAGKKLRYDTINGDLDISFLKSQLTLAQMRTGADSTIFNSKLLPYLVKEFIAQSPQKNYSTSPKTYVFISSETIDIAYCGFANSNIGGIIWTGANCWNGPQDDSTSPYGMSWPARSLIHEAIHVYGVTHVCDSNSDLMWGIPECTGTINYGPTVMDIGSNDYFGGERAGVDISKLPIWLDGPTTSAYSTVKATKTYAPYSLAAGASKTDWIFTVGGKSNLVSWDWERIDGPREGNLFECTLSNGKATITAQIKENQCLFDIPLNWRGGVTATATGKIFVGPYVGTATEQIKLWNPDNQFKACTEKYCFAGESVEISSNYCYSQDSKSFTLQQFVGNTWKTITTTPSRETNKCNSKSWEPVPVKYQFDKAEPFTYRWVQADIGNIRGYTEPISVITVLASDANYPVTIEKEAIDKAAQALAAEAAKKAEEERIARELYTRQLEQCAISGTNCYTGESFVVPSLCFYDDIGEINLEILNQDKWEVLTSGKVSAGASGCSSTNYGTPAFSYVFNEPGIKVLRWSVPATSKVIYKSAFYGILILDKSQGEPTDEQIAAAQATAQAQGKEADRLIAEAAAKAKAAAEAAAKAAAAKKKTTITCVKGKTVKKVTAIKPVCPKGYTRKK